MNTIQENLIVAPLLSSNSPNESACIELISDTKSGKTQLVIKKTITERYPVTELEKVIQLFNDLNRGGGRRVWSLSDLTK